VLEPIPPEWNRLWGAARANAKRRSTWRNRDERREDQGFSFDRVLAGEVMATSPDHALGGRVVQRIIRLSSRGPGSTPTAVSVVEPYPPAWDSEGMRRRPA
jgi:hypothetical protein